MAEAVEKAAAIVTRISPVTPNACCPVGAQITTSHDGFALDTIMLTRDLQTDEDELRRAEDDLQKLTDDHIEQINQVSERKESEVLEV